jgi:hypothetical protein
MSGKNALEAARETAEATFKKQCFCEDRCTVSLKRRKIAGNSRLKGASWSKFEEFADEFAAIRAAEFAEKLHHGAAAQPTCQNPGRNRLLP